MTETTPFSTLITETEQALSQVDGTSVQIYAEDRIALYLQETFDMVWSELWWRDYMKWYERTLDGTQGVVTVQIADEIKRYADIRFVFRDGSDRPLRALPSFVNPFKLSGSGPRYISRHEDDDRLLQFWPKTATGKVYIHARVKPDPFINTDEVKMDKWLLINGAAYKYAEDDGTNPGAIQKFQNLFEARLNQLKNEHNSEPLELDPEAGSIPTTWQEGRFV